MLFSDVSCSDYGICTFMFDPSHFESDLEFMLIVLLMLDSHVFRFNLSCSIYLNAMQICFTSLDLGLNRRLLVISALQVLFNSMHELTSFSPVHVD